MYFEPTGHTSVCTHEANFEDFEKEAEGMPTVGTFKVNVKVYPDDFVRGTSLAAAITVTDGETKEIMVD